MPTVVSKPSPPPLAGRSGSRGPQVSFVMPTYGRSHQIGATLRSLLRQTFADFELLVRDDGDGSDGKREAVEAAAAGDPRVRYHWNGQKLGIPRSINSGIEEACGEFIAVAHDHDIYDPTYLDRMVNLLRRYPSALFVHCGIQMLSQDDRRLQKLVGNWPELTSGPTWLKFMLSSLSCPVCALTLVRRKAHEDFGLYDPRFGFLADVEFWMRLSQHGDVAYIAEPLILVREREVDHHAYAEWTQLLGIVADIHRRYIPLAYTAPSRVLARLHLEWRVVRRWLRSWVSLVGQRVLRLQRA